MSRRIFMRTTTLAGVFIALVTVNARADDCAVLGGTITSGECRIGAAVSRSGAYAIDETLHILPTGSIAVPAAAGGATLVLNITGNLIIDSPPGDVGGQIVGDVRGATAVGAAIAINASGDIVLRGKSITGALISSNQVSDTCGGGRAGSVALWAGGSVRAEPGSVISANGTGCRAGDIAITGGSSVDIEALVQSQTTLANSAGGGTITVDAACNIVVGPEGTLQSKGELPGVDLVRLTGLCGVSIQGVVDPAPSGS